MTTVRVEFMDGKRVLVDTGKPPTGGGAVLESETTLMIYGVIRQAEDRQEKWQYFPRCNVRRYCDWPN